MFWAHILDVSLIFILQRKGTQMHIINTQRIRPALDIYKYDLIDTKTMLSDGSGVDNRMFGKDSLSIALILVSNRWTEIVVLEIRRSEEHTSELQSRENLVCRLLLDKKKKIN